MKIAWFRKVISPEVGADLAGYYLHDRSEQKLDDLEACGLLMEHEGKKLLLVSLDLLGLDHWFIQRVRKACAARLGIPDHAVLLTCTHTHTGPHTRTLNAATEAEHLNRTYLDQLERWLLDALDGLTDWHVCEAYYYSAWCDENRSRRYVTADNCASFTPHRRELIADCERFFADKELGVLMFLAPDYSQRPLYVIGNYAAHPLAGHAPGLGGLRISADFPGAFREYLRAETGAEAMFVTGAAGDMVPKEDELGSDAFRRMGVNLAKATIGAVIDAQRNPARFRLDDSRLGSTSQIVQIPFRKGVADNPKRLPAEYLGQDHADLEIQCLAVGDICFVGVPGELCAELGQEIKWHSPFRRTFIAYNSTAYISYMGPANFLVQGGYEARCQRLAASSGLALVNAAVQTMDALHGELFPDAGEPDADWLVKLLPNN